MAGTGAAGVPALSRSVVDRAAGHRPDEDFLSTRWADPTSRVLVLEDGAAAVTDGAEGAELVLLSPPAAAATDQQPPNTPCRPRLQGRAAARAAPRPATAAPTPHLRRRR